jgi:oligosaccharide repeat unit polymerase
MGTRAPMDVAVRHLFIKTMIIGLVIGLPFYYRSMQQAANSFDAASFLADVRRASLGRERTGEFRWLDNLPILAMLVAPVAWIEHLRARLRLLWPALIVFLAICYATLGGTKTGAMYALVPILFVHSLATGRIPWRSAIVVATIFITTFSAGLLFVNFALQWGDATVSNLVERLGQTFLGYWVGGLIGFDSIVAHPNIIESTQPFWRTVAELLNSFGGTFAIPVLHPDYTEISPSIEYNTYSIYFTYYKDLAWLGMFLFVPLFGAVCGFAHRFGRDSGSDSAIVLYGTLMTGVVLSPYAERFLLNANFLIKQLLFLTLVYSVIPWVVRALVFTTKPPSRSTHIS